ncbi:hypothetical protein NQ317_014254 [Molorchus minor]|uniref:Phosphatidic acid phosphatase type 2/haloperoxidase domain-containing protein n=1 Tax=Molorchus minor TaxID=1323400 RepID=A0ABQ9JG06_9CUCU|nr:hypothetical protein NQ317_014254 [Molorchus minor]
MIGVRNTQKQQVLEQMPVTFMIESNLSEEEWTESRKRLLDNKGMVTTTPPERPTSQTVHVNITDADKTQTQTTRIRCRRRLRVPHMINGFLAIIVLSVIVLTELGYVPGSKLGYICNDPSLSHPFNGDTVTPVTLLLGSALLPILVLLLTEILTRQTFKTLYYNEIWFFYKESLIGCTLVLAITEVMKVTVGEHRPHFLDVCEPDTNKDCVNGTFVHSYMCTTKKYQGYFLVDTSRSFPSGHSSVSVFVALFSAYIIQTRLPTAKTGKLLKPFLILVCLIWGLVCSLTRITDRRHHWWDVLAGATIGAIGAVYTLRLIHKKIGDIEPHPQISTSTTTLLDIKNKDATSVII